MAEHNLNSLDPMGFVKLIPNREAEIAKATPVEFREHPANRLARMLHPVCQYLTVSEISDNTENAKTYTLVPDKESGTDALAYFEAGQYLSVYFEMGNTKTTRPYSIASSPKDALNGFYRITVKAVEGGEVSNYILENWSVGTKVKASAPCGLFTYEPLRDADAVIAVAGGSGITPFLSLAKAIAEGTEDLDLTVLYGCRKEEEILHRRELCEIEKECGRVKVVYILSEEKKEGFESGFITRELIEKYAPEKPFSVFLCGPDGMYSFVDTQLEKLSLERKYIRHEVHGEAYSPNSFKDCPEVTENTVNIKVKCAGRSVTVTGNTTDTILRILEKGGLSAPSRCRSGECGFCRSKLISGEVFIPEEKDARRLADSHYGYIHPCCTYPLSDLEIEVSIVR